ncbi:hypothetical protein PN36_34975 [Candidatus Thiomargarita nelsonii]|uniref:LysM domain-containing protein n=1 Tax=Candidatus Thiomargarita nelsonii TaxID=1003181 RepID=A0A4E0QJJ6_9GAMM|nr:hypothetical protein PN36_34975 [Candidatus Thiomargarita nelsonii]
MLWVESGGASQAWKTRPMQIGNLGDPALPVLQRAEEGSKLIMSKELSEAIKSTDEVTNNPELNIKAGIAYLYTKMAKYGIRSLLDLTNKEQHDYTVLSGDSLSAIAKKVETTVLELEEQNELQKRDVIKIGQKLKYRKAKNRLVIVGWRAFTTANVYKLYNGGGDGNYTEKLDFVLQKVFPVLRR